MQDHLYEKISITDICGELHYNKSYIFREFKRVTGYTVMSYFIMLKIDAAKKMLRTSCMSVGDIAETLSFENSGYFSKVFKHITGYTPTKYRQMTKLQS